MGRCSFHGAFHAAFVNDEGQVDQMVEAVGPVDILVNTAGINRDGHMRKAKREDWDAVLDVNLTGPFVTTAPASSAPLLRRLQGRPDRLHQGSGHRGGEEGVTVNALAPGCILTEMMLKYPQEQLEAITAKIPVGQWAKPEISPTGPASAPRPAPTT